MNAQTLPALLRIGTCYSCTAQLCWKPKQPKLNPSEGCAKWTDGAPHTDDHLSKPEEEMPMLDIKREKRIAGLLNTSVQECKNALQHETDIELLETLHRRAYDRLHKTRCQYIQQRLNQLKKVKP
ncbi:hypothetical protein [Methylophaga lonarensis]|uniref:hypothetical protein n=1 Tax=Methylophaga lonarensis TaxID=999151 RepID=UPI003D2D0BA6